MDINEYISTRLDPQIEWYDEKSVAIDEFFNNYKWIRYTYDFGDDWRHKINIEKYDYTKYIIISYVSTSTTIFTHIFPFLRIFNIVYTKKQFFI